VPLRPRYLSGIRRF